MALLHYIFLITSLLSSCLLHTTTYRIQILEKPVKNGNTQRIVLYHDFHKTSALDGYQVQKLSENFNALSSSKLLGVETISPTSEKHLKAYRRALKLVCKHITDSESTHKDAGGASQLPYECKGDYDNIFTSPDVLKRLATHINQSTIVLLEKERLVIGEFEIALILKNILQATKELGLHKTNVYRKANNSLKPFDISIASFIEKTINTFTDQEKRASQLIDFMMSPKNKKFLQDLSKNLNTKYEELHSLQTQLPEKYLNKKFLNQALRVRRGNENEMPRRQQLFKQIQKHLKSELYEESLLSWGPELSILESTFSKNAPLTIWAAMGGGHAERMTQLLIEEGYALVYDTLTRIQHNGNRLILNTNIFDISKYKFAALMQTVLPLEEEFDDVLKSTQECKKHYELFLSKTADNAQLQAIINEL